MAHRVDDPTPVTLAQYEALADDDLYIDEVSCGRLVREPAPGDAHGRLVALLSHRLMQYVEGQPGAGRIYTEAGFILADLPFSPRLSSPAPTRGTPRVVPA